MKQDIRTIFSEPVATKILQTRKDAKDVTGIPINFFFISKYVEYKKVLLY